MKNKYSIWIMQGLCLTLSHYSVATGAEEQLLQLVPVNAQTVDRQQLVRSQSLPKEPKSELLQFVNASPVEHKTMEPAPDVKVVIRKPYSVTEPVAVSTTNGVTRKLRSSTAFSTSDGMHPVAAVEVETSQPLIKPDYISQEAVRVERPENISGRSGTAFFRMMIRKAFNHSPEIRAAQANIEGSGWDIEQVKGQRYPQLKVGLSTPFDSFGNGTSVNNSTPSDSSVNVSLNTTIWDWGKNSAELESANEKLNASNYAFKEEREQIAYNTAAELLNLSRYQADLRVARQYVARMQELVNMLSQIAEQDKGRASELTQARARLLSAKANLEQVQHQYDATRIKLMRLLGEEPVIPPDLKWDDGLIPGKAALSALNRHPTLLKNMAEAKAANAEADSIRASGLPQLNWVVSKSTAKDVNGDEQAWFTGLNVEWNAFSGGSERAARNSALAKARAASEQAKTTRLELEYQIKNMIETRDSSLRRAKDYERLSIESDKVRKMFYEQWYHLGKRTLLDVLTAETDHFNNQVSAVNNRYDGYVSNINIMSDAAILLEWLDNPVNA